MCSPTMLMIASTAVGAFGQIQQGNAGAANQRFQQQIAIDNAERTKQQMRDAAARGADKERQVKREGGKVVANTRAALASNNLDLTFGSPLDTIIEASKEVERDAYRVRTNTEREVDDLEMQRTNYLNQASAHGAGAKNAKRAGWVAGVGTALSGGSEVYKYKAKVGID